MSIQIKVLICILPSKQSKDNTHEDLHHVLSSNNYKIERVETVKEYLLWCSSNETIPTLLITNIDRNTPRVKDTFDKFTSTEILIIDSNMDDFSTTSSNNIHLFKTYEDILNHVELNHVKIGCDIDTDESIEEYEGQSEELLDEIFAYDLQNKVNSTLFGGETRIEDVNSNEIPPLQNIINNVTNDGNQQEPEEWNPNSEIDESSPHTFYEEDIFLNRSKEIRRQWSKSLKWKSHRTIGIWSPLHRTGVTSFSFNYAFYLAKNGIKSAILEGLTDNYTMKDWLKRYSQEPTNWSSLAKAIHSDNLPNQTLWEYGDVRFFPLDKEDISFDWNSNSLRYLIQTTNDIKATLVDLPTGNMSSYTKDSLVYLDELWIVVDDAIQETIAWKNYIHKLKDELDIPFNLIFNKEFSFSQSKRLSEELKIPLIATLPSLHEETMRNYYENKPLYFQKEVADLLESPFKKLTEHLSLESPELPTKKANKAELYFKVTKRFETLFKKW